MSSAQVLEALPVQQSAVFNIDQEQWDELPENNKSWWAHILNAWNNVKSKASKRYEYSSMTNSICFIFKTKTSVYHNLLLSLKSYGNVREKYYDREYYLIIKL